MPRSDEASIEIGEHAVRTWTSYSITSDLLVPADAFDMELEVGTSTQEGRRRWRELQDVIISGAELRVYIGSGESRSLQMVGIIDEVDATDDREDGPSIRIKGRDRAAHLCDSAAPMTLVVTETSTFIALVRQVVEPWNLRVVSEAATSRQILTGESRPGRGRGTRDVARTLGLPPELVSRRVLRRSERTQRPVDELVGVEPSDRARDISSNDLAPGDVERVTLRDAKPRPGETCWEFLDRHARRLGIMMWLSADGKLILSSPSYDQLPRYRFVRRFQSQDNDPNNILKGRRRQNTGERYSEVQVYGRARGNDVSRSRIKATATDFEFPHHRLLVVHDQRLRTDEEAERRATRELNLRKQNADQVTYVVPDHGQSWLYAIDTTAEIVDEVLGVEDTYYLVSRTFANDRKNGPTTQVDLIPRGSLVL